MTPKQFRHRFTNTMNDADAEAAYERYYVPAPGRVIYQAAFANVNPHAVTKVDFHKDDRPPLLVIGNDQDQTIPASVSREAAKRHGKSKAVVDYKEYARTPPLHGRRARLGSGGRLRARLGEPPRGRAGRDGGAGEGLTPAPAIPPTDNRPRSPDDAFMPRGGACRDPSQRHRRDHARVGARRRQAHGRPRPWRVRRRLGLRGCHRPPPAIAATR